MSKNIELQEEFESLISELERLKSINEITSENSKNAKKTIEEIESFVQSVKDFKTSIESDYQAKRNDLEGIENSLNESLKILNSNVDKQAKRFEKLSNNYTSNLNDTLDTVTGKMEVKIEEFISETEALKIKLGTDFTEFTEVTSKKIDDSSIKLNDLFILIKASLEKEITNLNKVSNDNNNEVLRQFQFLNNELETNKKSVKNLNIVIIISVTVAILTFGYLLYKNLS